MLKGKRSIGSAVANQSIKYLLLFFSFLFVVFASCKQPTGGGGKGGGISRSVTVTFNMMGHGAQIPKATVSFGNMLKEDAVQPADVADWTFGGWFTEAYTNPGFDDAKAKFNFKSPLTRDITLYAKWTVDSSREGDLATVTVDASSYEGKSTGIASYTIQMLKDEAIVLSDYDITISGNDYVVDTWQGDGYDAATGKITKAGDITITANWVQALTVSFDMNGKGAQIAPEKVKKSGTVAKPADPPVEDAEIEGWYKEKDFKNKWNFTSDTVENNMTLYAKWQGSYIITFNLQGKGKFPTVSNSYTWEEVDSYTKKVKIGDGVALSALSISNVQDAIVGSETFVFGSWCTDSNGQNVFVAATKFSKSMTLYAAWHGMCTINYEWTEPGIPEKKTDSQKVKWGTAVSNLKKLDDVEKYAFGGWKKDGKEFTSGTVKEDITLTGWYHDPVTVTFDMNGKPGTAPEAITGKWHTRESVSSSPTDPTGWEFKGWYAAKDGSGDQINSMLLEKDTTLYAKWAAKYHEVTIGTFNVYARDGESIHYVKRTSSADSTKCIWDIILQKGEVASPNLNGISKLLKGLKAENSPSAPFINTQNYKITAPVTLYPEYIETYEIFRKTPQQASSGIFFTKLKNIDDAHKAANTTWNLYYATRDMVLAPAQYTYKASLSSNSDYYSINVYNKNGTNDYYYCVSREGNIYTGSISGERNLSYVLSRDVLIGIDVNTNSRESNTTSRDKIDYVDVGIFQNLERLKIIDLQGFGLSKLTTTNNMFKGCTRLKEVRCSRPENTTYFLANKWRVSNMTGMFENCSSIEEIDFPALNMSSWSKTERRLIACSYMFSYCISLKNIYERSYQKDWLTESGNSKNDFESDKMFNLCVELRNYFTTNIDDITRANCSDNGVFSVK
ncbi:MAG: InlB B-repeat-containing protein [Treponema sp.]|nr:InlB B-repeat-containing protein [Treponema sp.]